MDRNKYLILSNGNDITADVKSCIYNADTMRYDIVFQSGKAYSYSYRSIEFLKDPEPIDPQIVEISHHGRKLFNCDSIQLFCTSHGAEYIHISFSSGSGRTYNAKDLNIVFSCLTEKTSQGILDYFRELAAVNELKSDDGKILLAEQYRSLKFVGENTVLAVYLNPEVHKIGTHTIDEVIFPFGGNTSQFRALENALHNQISVIQGPPGTGKTQTILNIIANLLVSGKTMQIVSSNNSATENIAEKLASPKYDLGFLVAALGKSENKDFFIANQPPYPSFSDWERTPEEQRQLKHHIAELSKGLHDIFAKQEQLAKARLELDSLQLEMRYFAQYCEEKGLSYDTVKPTHRLNSATLLALWQTCDTFCEKERAVSFWFKIRSAFIYGIANWSFYDNDISQIVTLLQHLFYESKYSEITTEISSLEMYLKDVDAVGQLDKLSFLSMTYLRAKLFDRYGNRKSRIQLAEKDFWKNPQKVLDEYPITLSTAFMSRGSLRGITYDYLIMDEASQVDIATGALALSCAKNAVIVGDLKQLPNVVKPDMRKRCDAIFTSSQLPIGYSYSENSFLKSICAILPQVPQTLLREHYRCHPKIIGFCNKKFYHNDLVIMTEDHGEEDVISVHKTVAGNHSRNHLNQRQIDVMFQDVLPSLVDSDPTNIGIIAPYRAQVSAIRHQIADTHIEVDTVHKFQGREKDTIFLTTVDDVATDFSDDPYLLNVAISRAKKRLSLVVSGNEQPSDGNIQDLISYIEYNNFKVVQSEIYSIFDYLYQQYTEARIKFLRRHSRVSSYDSENLMYGLLTDLLEQHPHLPLTVICHLPLRLLIRNTQKLTPEEAKYVMHPSTHLDFLVYNQVSKMPVLAIEVDGFHNHKQGTIQYDRDRKKDHILQVYSIPLFRFPTNGSGERETIIQFLKDYEKR